MKAIHYSGDVVITGDAIADALVHYAEALARRDSAASVDIPVRLPDGTVDVASVLLGPASQMVATPEHSDDEEIVDDELVARMERETGALENPKPLLNAERDNSDVFDDFDLP